MSSVAFNPVPNNYRIGRVTPQSLKRWGPSLALWGIGAGLYATYFLSVTPLVKRELLTKIPIVGNYYADKIPAEDKPF
ncbi:cytochrome b-c1 complex subunit 10, partial [Gautieria morchelliformis]